MDRVRAVVSAFTLLATVLLLSCSGDGTGPENRSPTVRITAPAAGSTVLEGGAVSLSGSATDPEDGTLPPSALHWSSDVDGELGIGSSLTVDLSMGVHRIILAAADRDGQTGTADIRLAVTPNQTPTAEITAPADGPSYVDGTPITFEGSGLDPEDGALSGSALSWSSDLDGELGNGASMTVALSVGSHLITLVATDRLGLAATAAVTVVVEQPNTAPTASFTFEPADPVVGEAVRFDASGSSDPEGDVLTYAWNFGEGHTAPGEATTQTFQQAGELTVTLTVTDGQLADETTRTLTVAAPQTLDFILDGLHLNQASQDQGGTIGGVAGRAGLLRVMVRATEENTATPLVRLRLYRHGVLMREELLTGPPSGVPVDPDLRKSNPTDTWDLALGPAEVQEGLAVEAMVDPDHRYARLDASENGLRRVGVASLDVQRLGPFRIVFIPIEATVHGTTGAVNPSNANEYLAASVQRIPIGDLSVTVHATLTTNQDLRTAAGWSMLLSDIQAIRTVEGATDHYYHGIIGHMWGLAWGGLAYIAGSPSSPSRSGLSHDRLPFASATIAHELGHNLGRFHAPCGSPARPDRSYPYANARIGPPGYDILTGALVWTEAHRDYMSYCDPEWTSDYTYGEILTWRRSDGLTQAPTLTFAASPVRSTRGLLLWGRLGSDGPTLNPAFALDAPPSLPRQRGPNVLRGVDVSGTEIFRFSFRGVPVAESLDPDERHFAFFVPVDDAALQTLARVDVLTPFGNAIRRSATVTGEDPALPTPAADPSIRREAAAPGVVRLRWNAAPYPMALVRDTETGQVLGFARGGSVVVRPQGRSLNRLEVLVSDGVRTRVAR